MTDFYNRQTQQFFDMQNVLQRSNTDIGQEFRTRIDIVDAIYEDDRRLNGDGEIMLQFPQALQGQKMEIRVERFTWHLN